ncbi:arabinan endo-1,5-alpha-L-arabinosidase [Devosia pacifica]|uniref:Extracellular exo-alpha-(1->5)-L-arabinofuranosidase n=1 Tax=Devosia pacifica TaxID=1335967 RepID=A0A918S6Q0_9HYPH|nr:arabinan endo-1,5-alpha-L-arabinosidase [Devosia pacifica]GHA25880.1 arabinan endo-1,5-alpha-L-arabinosidase [Devosia pacifica]
MRVQRALLLACLAGSIGPAIAQEATTQPELSGVIAIHDPSVIEYGGRFASFATGVENAADSGTPRTKTSPDGTAWRETGALPGGLPGWVETELGYTPKNLWAPSISHHGGTHYLYYSASSFGENDSAIGVMTNKQFDITEPAEGWQDQGMVLRSHDGDDFNAIDPFRIDTDGRSYLAYGSYWDGIRMVELDPESGMLKDGAADPIRLASRDDDAIEAPSLLEHDGRYYLFVSFDACCRGAESTYRIMVGRADEISGPYLDADDTPMLEGGGTEVLASTGRYRGPGGQEIFMNDGEPWLTYHYYDAEDAGTPKLQIAPLRWTEDGWPKLDPLPVSNGT